MKFGKTAKLAILTSIFVIPPVAAQTGRITQKPINVGAISAERLDVRRFPSVLMPGAKAPQKRAVGAATWAKIDPKVADATQANLTAQLLANAIKKKLNGKSIGFAVTVMTQSGGKGTAVGGLARSAPDGGQRGWNASDRITVASVSKSFSAAAMMRVMASKGVGINAKIGPYLPASWTAGANFKDITFAQLMNHTSGIRGDGTCNISNDGLKGCTAKGVVIANKTYFYQNENAAMLRILLPRVYGNAPVSEADYAKDYEVIVNRMVMNSAGIPYATCKAGAGNVSMSYESTTDNGQDGAPQNAAAVNFDWTSVKPGIDWGDMSTICGSQGWNLSSDDLAKFAHALAFTDRILPQASVNTMRDNSLGLFYSDFGGGLDGYGHNGWHPAGWNQGEINTWSFSFNKGVSIGLVINSRYNGSYSNDVAAAVKEVLP
ncbi:MULTISPECIES: serine hydrolase domain-containing protein [unclassified Novosphingobium]|uniref:serine hydrolase domain-containing protein n=1 Tax=unclassified Novosphingobium TaxID=2644732 RepID=UPI0025D4832D|nr:MULTISPECIES: serine hydrolase domain-containing protein [unclassified Novosphingobium]HQV03000.1 serine hydrolase domain-containing protein [Novosphingobium sp.]